MPVAASRGAATATPSEEEEGEEDGEEEAEEEEAGEGAEDRAEEDDDAEATGAAGSAGFAGTTLTRHEPAGTSLNTNCPVASGATCCVTPFGHSSTTRQALAGVAAARVTAVPGAATAAARLRTIAAT
jgi:hypothetical protein